MDNDVSNTKRTAQEFEILNGGGAEAAEKARKGFSRRQFLRRAVGITSGVILAESVGLGLYFIYPLATGSFGGIIKIGKKTDFPAASPLNFDIENGKGVFYQGSAQAYVVHLSADTPWVLQGDSLKQQLEAEWIVQDTDGTYWAAFWQRCVHLGCKYNYKTDCRSFKCPCHGSHYNADGEYLSGPAPRSLDRFQLSFQGEDVMVNTGKLNTPLAPYNLPGVPRPTDITRLLVEQQIQFLCQ